MNNGRPSVLLAVLVATPPLAAQWENIKGTSGASRPVEFHAATWFTKWNGPQVPILYRSDGTSQGTTAAVDLGPLLPSNGSYTAELAVAGEHLFIAANPLFPSMKPFLFVSDGTPAGTSLLWSGSGSFVVSPEPVSGILTFFVTAGGVGGGPVQGFWRSDGTPAGTFVLPMPGGRSSQARIATLERLQLWTVTTLSTPPELWCSDGTVAGTRFVATLTGQAQQPTTWRGRAYFTVRGPDNKQQFWQSDGTTAGTSWIIDPPVEAEWAFLSATDDALVFGVKTSTSATYWKNLTGVKNAHVPLQQVALKASSYLGNPARLPGRIVVVLEDSSHGREPWVIEPLTNTVQMLSDTYPGPIGGCERVQSLQGGDRSTQLPFAAGDAVTGTEPWVTDGTPAGTRAAADLLPGLASSLPNGFMRAGDRIWLLAGSPVEIWTVAAATLGIGGVDDLGGGCTVPSGRIARLQAPLATPVLGASCDLLLSDAPPSQGSFWALSLVRVEAPVWGCGTIRVGNPSIGWSVPLDTTGSAQQRLQIPTVVALLGASAQVQTATVAGPASVALSNALRLVIGLP